MPLTDDDICRITESVWLATLDLPLDDGATPLDDGFRFTGCVVVSGAWHGAVTVDVSEALARRATATMFDVAADDVDDEEVRDALGELTNMTGGNIKSLLGGACQLSIPWVAGGREYTVSIPGATVVNTVALGCGGEPLHVTVLERQVA